MRDCLTASTGFCCRRSFASVQQSSSYRGQVRQTRISAILLILHCIEAETSDSELHLSLIWEVSRAPGQDLDLFLHGVNTEGELLYQEDGPPLSGMYPTRFWQAGQTLRTESTLRISDEIAAVKLGLYDPLSGARTSVEKEGKVSDHIVLTLEKSSCAH